MSPSQELEQLHELLVWLPGRGAMRTVVQAESLEQAVELAEKRYSRSRVEVPQAAVKPKLVRSHTGPKLAARLRKKLMEANG